VEDCWKEEEDGMICFGVCLVGSLALCMKWGKHMVGGWLLGRGREGGRRRKKEGMGLSVAIFRELLRTNWLNFGQWRWRHHGHECHGAD